MRLQKVARIALVNVAILGIACESVAAQTAAPAAQTATGLTYADIADLALQAPVVAHVKLIRATRLKPEQAAGVAPGRTRFYVEADVLSLIRGAQGLPARVAYLADVPNDASGRPAKLREKDEFLLLATSAGARPDEIRLISADAQLSYNAAQAEQVRSILREALAPDAAPRITGIGRAFHVPGSLPGESETQIFLLAADGRPVSLNVLRRPGETPRWAVSLTEIVDDAAAPPQRDTLLWYRLACTLPANLPQQSLADSDAAAAQAIQADYRLIRSNLGQCVRTRQRP